MKLLLLLCLLLLGQLPAAQQPVRPPTLATTDAYVRQVDADKTLTIKRHIHTYGHAAKPGVDSLFWVFHTDFQFSTIVVYFSGRNIVKLVETARTDTYFNEYSYYLQNSNLLYVKNRKVYCPISIQLAALRSNTLPYTRNTAVFFKGSYYFAQDSCISKQEHGKSDWNPEYKIPGGNGHWVTVPKIFPYQAARYLACFPHPPAPKRR